MTDNETQKPSGDNVNGLIDTLSAPQKAAAILVAIGWSFASRLLKHFNAADLRNLRLMPVHSNPFLRSNLNIW